MCICVFVVLCICVFVYLCLCLCIGVFMKTNCKSDERMAKSDARRCSWTRKSAPVSNVTLLTCQPLIQYNDTMVKFIDLSIVL